ncbi:MAG: AAA family ATPase [Bacillota bacterium]
MRIPEKQKPGAGGRYEDGGYIDLRRLKRVVLENFQSHRYTEIGFAPTMTVLIGESDQGKSAVVRALRWLFYNKPHGADFMRAGSDYCRVAAELDDGLVIIRERRGKTNRYEIRRPGQEPHILEGFGREVPAEVEELTEVQPLRLEGATFELHVAHQLDPPFLLKETPAVRARAVGHLSGTHLFDAAGKRAGRKIAVLSRTRQELEEKLAGLEIELQGFHDLQEVETRHKRCADSFQKSRNAYDSAVRLSALRDGHRRVTEELAQKDGLIQSLPDPGEMQVCYEDVLRGVLLFERIKDLYEKRERIREDLVRINDVINRTSKMEKARRITGEVEFFAERIYVLKADGFRLTGLQQEQKKISEMLARFQAVLRAEEAAGHLGVRIVTLGSLKERHARWKECSFRLQRVETALAGLENVPAAEKWREHGVENARRLAALLEFQRRYIAARKDHSAETEKYGRAQAEVIRLAAELRDILLKVNRCPVCLTPLSAERIEAILENELGEEK